MGLGAIADIFLLSAINNMFFLFLLVHLAMLYTLIFDDLVKICGTVGFRHLRGISYHSMLVFASVVGGDLFNMSVTLLGQVT